jgi:hypothetical protein
MENIRYNFFKIPLYRLFFSTILGLLGILLIFHVYNYNVFNDSFVAVAKEIPAPVWIFFFLLCFFLGEIVALLGEVIVNLFFDFNPLRTRSDNRQSFFETLFSVLGDTIFRLIFNFSPSERAARAPEPGTARENQPEQDEIVEKLTPFSLENITYNKDLRKLRYETLFNISEFHLIFSRIVAGFALLLFIFGSTMVEHDILFIFLIDLFIIFILYLSLTKPSFVKFGLLVCIVVFTFYCYRYFSTQCYSGIILVLISMLLFLSSANYRAFANNIIKYSMKHTLDR